MLWVTLLVGLFLLKGSSTVVFSQALGAWLAIAWVLEAGAPALPGFGYLSLAPALWLAVAVQHPEASLLPLLGSGLGLIARSLRGHTRPVMLEVLSDLQPLALALGLAVFFGKPWLGPPLWGLFSWLVPALLPSTLESEWSYLRARFAGQRLTCVGLACLALWLPPDALGPPGLMGLLLAGLLYANQQMIRSGQTDRIEIDQRRQERSLRQREQGLQLVADDQRQIEVRQRKTEAELQVRLESYHWIDEMLQAIPEKAVFSAVAQLINERLGRRFGVKNVVCYWLREGTLQAASVRSPLADRVAAAPLTLQSEPSVLEAFQSGKIAFTNTGESRIFPEDIWVCAVPLPARGVIYLGNPQVCRLHEEDVHFLEVLGRHAVLALDAAACYESLQSALVQSAEMASKNEALVHRVALVIDGVTQLIRLRQPQAMLQSTAQLLARLVPHDSYFASSEAGEFGSDEGSRELARKVSEQQLPLLLENPPRLAIPLLSERGSLGALVLLRRGPAFSREDQDILSVLSYQLGSALASAQLYAELQKTHAALRDSQAQLVQSSKLAAVGQLAGGVAHELNTPLGAVALAIEAAQMNMASKPERAATRLERASKAVGQMKEIVSKLLFYSRDARSGHRQCNLNEVLDDTLQLVGHQLRLDNIEVIQELGPEIPLFANPNELQQVLINLILNARDAMLEASARGRQLNLATGGWEGGVWVRISDQGCGMPPEVIERIFEPFYTTKEVGKGTGLGLSVTSQLVEQHGGKLSVESTLGQGTTFLVRLPLEAPEVSA